MEDWTWWIVVALGLASVEALSGDLIFIMLAAAALAAAAAASMGAPLLVQIVILALVSVLLLVLARPAALRLLHRSGPARTGVDLLPGSTAEVLEPVDGRDGRVRLRGEVWSARSVDGSTHQKGESVTVLEVSGATVIVR